MAIVLDFDNSTNEVSNTYSTGKDNIIYADNTYLITIVGTITSDIPGGEFITQAYSNSTNINFIDYLIDGNTPTFPLFIPDGSGLPIQFSFIPLGIIGNIGKVFFDFGFGIGFYGFYFPEIDPTDSINYVNPLLSFPTIIVGSSSNIDMYINNGTCLAQNYYFSCSNPDISFASGVLNIPPYEDTLYDRVYWNPTSAYSMNDVIDIAADTYTLGTASFVSVQGTSDNPPPPSAYYSKKITISNSISL